MKVPKAFTDKLPKTNHLFLPMFAVFIALAETLVACGYIFIGAFVYLLAFLLLLITACYKYQGDSYSLYLVLALIPLVRIISVAIPLAGLPEPYEFVLVGAPLLIAGVTAVKVVGLTTAEIGICFRKPVKQLLIALLGLPLGFIEYLIAKPGIKDTPSTPGAVVIWVLVLLLFSGLLEEFLYRGIIFNVVLKQQNEVKAIYFTSLLYAAMAISGRSFFNVIFVFFVSVLFCRLFGWLKSILGLSLAHGLINITLYIICPHIFGLPGK